MKRKENKSEEKKQYLITCYTFWDWVVIFEIIVISIELVLFVCEVKFISPGFSTTWPNNSLPIVITEPHYNPAE